MNNHPYGNILFKYSLIILIIATVEILSQKLVYSCEKRGEGL